MNKENYVIITAGGIGTRMDSEIPKQFLNLSGKPLLMHTIKRFHEFDKHLRIVLSLPEHYIPFWENLCLSHRFELKHTIVAGGETRFQSIKNALQKVKGSGLVAVHDGVRPLVCSGTILRTFEAAEKHGSGVASADISFSVREVKKNNSYAVNRNNYKEIQTPQTFQIDIIKKAYEQANEVSFTDDATVVEKYGKKIFLTEGNKENIKITNPVDLKLAEFLLNRIV